jgi:RNA polymerase sigma factor (sigma-70 family)
VRWYGDDNSSADTQKGGTGKTTRLRGDSFNLTVYDRNFTTPAWLQGATVYEIFADRFRNGDPANDPCRLGPCRSSTERPRDLHPTWNEPVEDARATGFFNRDFFGGDLQGVTEELDYLKSLGVDAIWLTPIFKARSNHRYDTDDYMQVDPYLGGDAAYDALKAAAKAEGIHLILDGVFNHTSSDSRYFDKYHRYPDVVGACESASSPYRDWYSITGDCADYAKFAGLDTLPQLNHSNPAVLDFVASVARHWSPDGWRLDAAQEIDHRWWRSFRQAVSGPLIGEVTAGPVDATPYLLGDELDGVMNYRFRQAALGFAQRLTPAQLDHSLKAILADYPRARVGGLVQPRRLARHEQGRVRDARRTTPRRAAAVHELRRADALLRRRGRRHRAGQERLRRPVQPGAISVGLGRPVAARVLPQARRDPACAPRAPHRVARDALDERGRLRIRARRAAGQARDRRAQQRHVAGDGDRSGHEPPGPAHRRTLHGHRPAARRRRPRRNLLARSGVRTSVVGRPLDESDLIRRAQRGDTHAYEELVHAYQGIAFRTAYVIARNASDAEDAAQDGFVKAWRALGRFREGAPFRPWLLRIVANEASNRRRSAGRRREPRAARGDRGALGGRGPVPRGGTALRRAAGDAARGRRAAAGGTARRRRAAAISSGSPRRRSRRRSRSRRARSSRAPRVRSSG